MWVDYWRGQRVCCPPSKFTGEGDGLVCLVCFVSSLEVQLSKSVCAIISQRSAGTRRRIDVGSTSSRYHVPAGLLHVLMLPLYR